jgi:hypothetical protein
MLLWEALTTNGTTAGKKTDLVCKTRIVAKRLPFDTRCSIITKSGKRCRGKIHGDGNHCPLHDPQIAAKRREAANKPRKPKNPLSRLPDGYLRKLSNYAAAGNAMDRLYREVRLGLITPEMGRILFGILTRLMDTGLLENTKNIPRRIDRTKAARLRPKMDDLLTRAEKLAWRKAVADAPPKILKRRAELRKAAAFSDAPREKKGLPAPSQAHPNEQPLEFPLQVAS